MGKWMESYMDRLSAVRRENQESGGKERQEVQHQHGKMTARERIGKLVDPGSFQELGALVRDTRQPHDGIIRPSPGDGAVMGLAKIQSRPVTVYSMDFTVMSGSLGTQEAWKLADLTRMAGQNGMPLVGIIDSAGCRVGLKDGDTGFNGLAQLLRNQCLYSGVVPSIAVLLGPCTGPMAVMPVLFDFLIIHEKNGFLWMGGEKLSEGAGEGVFQMERCGQCDLLADDDVEALEMTRTLLGYLPSSCWERAPFLDTGDDPERMEESLLEVMPDDPKFTYDIHEIIEKIVDKGKFLELKAEFAPNLVIGFARFGGHVAGIVANNPDELSGILEPDSSDKYDRFMRFLDAFQIPLVTLVDTTAFPPGDRWERMGVIRHGAKLLHSYAHLTCPKITIVLRRAYGGANIVEGCSKMFPDLVYGWPTAEFAPTGPETVVHAVFHKELKEAKEAGNYDTVYEYYLNILKDQFSVMNMGKNWTTYYTVHEVIDPRETRKRIIRGIEALSAKKEQLPEKKGSIKPA